MGLAGEKPESPHQEQDRSRCYGYLYAHVERSLPGAKWGETGLDGEVGEISRRNRGDA